jgi:asparagine synthase (glutamine-hydrolysing)
MCGIAGAVSLGAHSVPHLRAALRTMNDLQAHRGPDGHAVWTHPSRRVGLAHRRLAIIDLRTGDQPMADDNGNQIVFNGEIYNYRELRAELGADTTWRTSSDTEVILKAYSRWGDECVAHLRGMFAFALWDQGRGRLLCARDRFGMKPFYWVATDDAVYFASEVKALLPFLRTIRTDERGLLDYLTFQFCMEGKTLFAGVNELPAAHLLSIGGRTSVRRYWEVYYDLDFSHTSSYFEEALRDHMAESIALHLRADVPVGAYVSGGLDSGIVASLAARRSEESLTAYTGCFRRGPQYDETPYARDVAKAAGLQLRELEITCSDFVENIRQVVYHMDFPVAGPGAFSQFMVSRLAASERKVVLGGQGGDEIFGGYARYLVAYFEQCLKAAIDGTMDNGNFVVSYRSIIPNLVALQQYKPMLQEFWREGLFEEMDRRYYRLVDRAPHRRGEIRWECLTREYTPFDAFSRVFNAGNVPKSSYFDLMTHFDFKTLLPALLHVEDRMSMAHGLESRLPFLDHPMVALAATIPADVKFEGGLMKRVLRKAFEEVVPRSVLERKDKMGFPTPFNDWLRGEARGFALDVLSSSRARQREHIDNDEVVKTIDTGGSYSRHLWGFFCLELWQQEFHDQHLRFARALADNIANEVITPDRAAIRSAS